MPSRNQSNRGGKNRGRRSNNNNPEGYNQYNSGWMDTARERPVATAAAAAAAVGAGVFLWSKRGQISEQLANISDQIGEWTENMSSNREFETVGGEPSFSGATAGGATGTATSDEFGASGIRSTGTKSGTTRSGRTSTSGTSTTSSGRRGTATGSGSGTMSGGSLDTGPSGRS